MRARPSASRKAKTRSSKSSEDEAEQNPGLTGSVARLWKAFLLLEGRHRRRRLVAINPVDPARVRADREQQALEVPDRVAASPLVQVRVGKIEVDVVGWLHVMGPTIPSTGPATRLVWKDFSEASVLGPKSPSMGPGSVTNAEPKSTE